MKAFLNSINFNYNQTLDIQELLKTTQRNLDSKFTEISLIYKLNLYTDQMI